MDLHRRLDMETPVVAEERGMIDSMKYGRTSGVLFILGTVPMIAAMLLFGQHLSSPDILSAVAEHRFSTLMLALSVLVMGIACGGIGISLYPVIKRHSEGLAVAVTGLRLMEGAIAAATAVGFFALVAVSQEFVKAGSPPGSLYQAIGAAIKAVNDWASYLYVLPFGAAALIYYAVFYRIRLVPRWLAAWGFAGILLILVSCIGGVLALVDPSSPVLFLLNMPILVQELVLALWLIVKGFSFSANPRTTSKVPAR
jgi:hypothetical protein